MARGRFPAFTLVLILSDASLIALSYATAYYLRFRTDIVPFRQLPSTSVYYTTLAVITGAFLLTFLFYGLYHLRRGVSLVDQLYRVSSAVSVGTLLAMAIVSLIFRNQLDFSRLMVAYAWFLSIVLVTSGRAAIEFLQSELRRVGYGAERVLIVGAGDTGRMVMGKIRRTPGLGYRIVGFLDDDPRLAGDLVDGVPVIGGTESIAAQIREHGVDQVIIALPSTSHERILEIITQCEGERATIKVFPDLLQLIASEVSVDELSGLPLITVGKPALRGWKFNLKRGMDLAISLVVLVFLSWVMMLIALVVKLTSRGPVFYVQDRVGQDGKPFPCIKFRSMRAGAEDGTGPVWAVPDDDRRTRLGVYLRKYSLDELPQFINVLLNHMSIVGPRPERPHFVERFRSAIPRYMERHELKAGITGWAQVNGFRGNTSIEERTKYDLYYVENWSPLFDLKIMMKTALLIFTDPQGY